ncbi:alpha-mannosidase-like protein [Protomyces lactucae-debilis]|uniref:Alpha-mannosidase n=1 Tax=Protomyces lactucae-debilis TaxID=2754530 RepID=A0A1Y2FC03_PROLT|nr:alpha-mannosidase-like protein [Protomyces lactucae-debilis]ORY80856.1 alpha-mannosidase-like protein [Protomyces lactucae-debilis]
MGGATRRECPSSSQPYARYGGRIRGPEIRHIDTDRLDQFRSTGEFRDVNLMSMMEHGRVDDTKFLSLEVYSPSNLERPLFKDAVKNQFCPAKKGQSFGPSWSTHWFRVTIHQVPEEWKKLERIQLEFDLPEAMVYSEDGEPLQGLTGGSEARRVDFILTDGARSKKTVYYIEAAMNGLSGLGQGSSIQPPDQNRYFTLDSADLVAPNMTAVRLSYDFWILKDLARELPQNGFESHEALAAATKIMNTFQRGDQASLDACRKIADKVLGPQRDSAAVYKPDDSVYVTAIGNCHIDTAWLWPFAETRRKIGRSWASQIDLMERYPEHVFACSQAQQFKWMQQDYPKLANKIARKIKDGQFEPIGGSWVEMDSNLPSGESLVRQFLFGQRLYEKQCGRRCKVAWLPDSFGYSSQFPQLARLAGMDYFFTQKLSWNNINTFPNTTMNWQALDGTQILTHMTPNETYTSNADLGDVIRSQSQHKSLTEAKDSLLVFGFGDGGGGPHKDMFEKLRRCRGAANTNAPSLPKIKFNTVERFFSDLERNCNGGKDLRTWVGELYFEFHRGTYTSQALTKKNNRNAERMLHELEWFGSAAALCVKTYTYPRKAIEALWEDVLLCQFHDVLPGSCIEMVYNDVHKMHAKVLQKGVVLIDEALSALGVSNSVASDTVQTRRDVIINSLPWDRSAILEVRGQLELVHSRSSLGSLTVGDKLGDVRVEQLNDRAYMLENSDVRLHIEDGAIRVFYDVKTDRMLHGDTISKPLNQFVLFEDQPLNWQAWDVEIYHLDKEPRVLKPYASRILLKSSHRVTIEFEYKISEVSSMVNTISLDSSAVNKPKHCQVNFECKVDWHENKSFLKVEFPTNLHANEARYETQFGVNTRPTHRNTTWDAAKFEVCCHKFADLSEARYGLAILNDSKYGFATLGSNMTLSLLRAPKAPDATADMGMHQFRYAMLTHATSFEGSDVTRLAAEFNNPLRLAATDQTDLLVQQIALVPLPDARENHTDHVILDTIKLSEDNDRAIVLRIYEAIGAGGHVRISVPTQFGRVRHSCLVNLLEDECLDRGLCFPDVKIRPFEVLSIKLVLDD